MQVYFTDNFDAMRRFSIATVEREGPHFVVRSSEEDIQYYLESRADTAYYFDHADDLTSFRDIIANIGNGVNKYSYAGYRIVRSS